MGIDEALVVAAELRGRVPGLGRADVDKLAVEVAPFLGAGWNVEDIVYALERRPDGVRHERAIDPGDWHAAVWSVGARLHTWRVGYDRHRPYDLVPVGPSRSDLVRAEQARLAEAQAACRERGEVDRAAEAPSGSPARAQAMALARSLRQGSRSRGPSAPGGSRPVTWSGWGAGRGR
jgi:hypothetical protein